MPGGWVMRAAARIYLRVSRNPIQFIILTQSHANQYGGLELTRRLTMW